jgi:hypothetical protein
MTTATPEDPVQALQQAFADVGLDPTGIDLAWLADFKRDTEEKIAQARRQEGFVEAVPTFVQPPAGARGGRDGAA